MTRGFFFLLLLAGCTSSEKGDQLPPYNRTLVNRPLMPTSPLNLLRDPLIGGDGSPSYGQFRAYFENGMDFPLTRTFQSVSPVGGAVSIEELRDIPPPAGATKVRVTASFLGGAGTFHASIWLSAGDGSTAPLAFSDVDTSINVTLLGNDGSTKATLAASGPVTYGSREWVQLTTTTEVAFPSGGWLSVELTNFNISLQLAAPEVTTSALE